MTILSLMISIDSWGVEGYMCSFDNGEILKLIFKVIEDILNNKI